MSKHPGSCVKTPTYLCQSTRLENTGVAPGDVSRITGESFIELAAEPLHLPLVEGGYFAGVTLYRDPRSFDPRHDVRE